jgi:hypothetical protein
MSNFFDAIADPRAFKNLGQALKNFTPSGRAELDEINNLAKVQRQLELQKLGYQGQQLGAVPADQSSPVIEQLRNAFMFNQERGAANMLDANRGPGAFRADVAGEELLGMKSNRNATDARVSQGWEGLLQSERGLDINERQNTAENNLRQTGLGIQYQGNNAGFGNSNEQALNDWIGQRLDLPFAQTGAVGGGAQGGDVGSIFAEVAQQARGSGQGNNTMIPRAVPAASGERQYPPTPGALSSFLKEPPAGYQPPVRQQAPSQIPSRQAPVGAAAQNVQQQAAPAQPRTMASVLAQQVLGQRPQQPAQPSAVGFNFMGDELFNPKALTAAPPPRATIGVDRTPAPRGQMRLATGATAPRLEENTANVMSQQENRYNPYSLEDIIEMVRVLQGGAPAIY